MHCGIEQSARFEQGDAGSSEGRAHRRRARRSKRRSGAVQVFTEWPTRSKRLFLRSSGRKTATHFSWNCSKGSPVR
ncbi:MAG: hypothetical protein E5V89_28050 [Mesorhizobium sp.]|nr:MAG: hypothetical protein E5V89_28050 [Mesorhizobium sp.]